MVAGVPAAVRITCPRCKIVRAMFNVDGGTLYRCAGCEWYWTFGQATVATPSFPATTVPVTNSTGTIVAVTITGGTLTSVSVGPVGSLVQVGTTAGTYLVPAGQQIAVTWSVSPGWTWALPVTSGTIAIGGAAIPVASGGAYMTPAATPLLLIDSGTSAEVLTAAAGATGTSVPVAAASKAHGSGVSFGQPALTSTLGGVGQDSVPAAPGWGF